jgi:hypothetical protein
MSTSEASNSLPASVSPPKRFIYTMKDMDHFTNSPAKRDLLSFVTTLGRCTIESTYKYDNSDPLIGLSPGMASLHGSLNAIASTWLKELPPDEDAKARFGNPRFKAWHERLVRRSGKIIESIMNCHVRFIVNKEHNDSGSVTEPWDMDILKQCSEAGQAAAICNNNDRDGDDSDKNDNIDERQKKVIIELQAYFHQAFGHEIRLDYGTGHECSFYIFLYALCKIGIFGNIPKTVTPSNDIMAPVALSITSQYLQVCRGIQTDYMLEPAGSHGVWGLDDYHCVPFYIGACQLQNKIYQDDSSNCDYISPSCVHDKQLAENKSILYFTCIQYIKFLKKSAPFFESSPMLNDISQLPNWHKVSGGLLRLFEGEVLKKKPVVQHFVFGDIFKASWTPTITQREAPSTTFNHDIHGIDSVAPWAK